MISAGLPGDTLFGEIVISANNLSLLGGGWSIRLHRGNADVIAAAKSNGVQFGRPRKPLPSNFEELYQRFRKNEPITRLAKECPEISESTLRLRLQERFDLDRKR